MPSPNPVEEVLESIAPSLKDAAKDVLMQLGLFVYLRSPLSTTVSYDNMVALRDSISPELAQALHALKRHPAGQSLNTASQHKHSRADAVVHYPFMDATGTVKQVLESIGVADSTATSLSRSYAFAPWPEQRRKAEAVFREFQMSNSGIKVSDLPEALERLGFRGTIPTSFRRTCASSPGMTLSLDQWLVIVERFIQRVNPTPVSSDSAAGVNDDGFERDNRDWIRPRSTLSARKRRERRPASASRTFDPHSSRGQPKETKATALRRQSNGSRIARMVASDKNAWKSGLREKRRATDQMLAGLRMDRLDYGRPLVNSGSEVLDIADAFLSSSIAQGFAGVSNIAGWSTQVPADVARRSEPSQHSYKGWIGEYGPSHTRVLRHHSPSLTQDNVERGAVSHCSITGSEEGGEEIPHTSQSGVADRGVDRLLSAASLLPDVLLDTSSESEGI